MKRNLLQKFIKMKIILYKGINDLKSKVKNIKFFFISLGNFRDNTYSKNIINILY